MNYIGMLLKFLTYNGSIKFYFICLMFLFTTCIYMSSDFWLGIWSINYFNIKRQSFYLIIYIVIGVVLSFYILFRDVVYQKFISAISNKVYMNSVDNVVNAEMRWHNNISLAKIIYRLTMD